MEVKSDHREAEGTSSISVKIAPQLDVWKGNRLRLRLMAWETIRRLKIQSDCPLLPEFTCSNCEQPLCYPCAIKAYIGDHTREEDIALSCSQCNKIFKTRDKWLLIGILKTQ